MVDNTDLILSQHQGDKNQMDFILSDEKRIQLEASAGYGKTHSIISKIAYTLLSGKLNYPKKILMLTFSISAADRMRRKIDEEIPKIIKDYEVGDFMVASNYHGFCRRIIELYGFLVNEDLAEINAMTTLDDRKSTENFQYIKNLDLGLSDSQIEFMQNYSEAIKNRDFQSFEKYFNDYTDLNIKIASKGVITYNGIITVCVKLMREHKSILNHIQKMYSMIIVDEFQDTNFLGYILLDLLVESQHKLILVGDSNQRIYSFIGAIPNIFEISKDKYGTKSMYLNTNYRFSSKPEMLLLEENLRKYMRDLSAENISEACKLKHSEFSTQEDEATYILNRAKRKISENRNVAILVRARNKNTDRILKSFYDEDINFFYGLYSDNDDEYLSFHNKSLHYIYENSWDKFNKKLFNKLIKYLRSELDLDSLTINSLFKLLDTCYATIAVEYFHFSSSEKLEIFKEVLRTGSLKQYMGKVKDKIFVSTIHGSKGLEWDHVIVPDLEVWGIPSFNLCIDCPDKYASGNRCNFMIGKYDSGKLKEELNLFYVSITRAKESVEVTSSIQRFKADGHRSSSKRSCFLSLPGLELC